MRRFMTALSLLFILSFMISGCGKAADSEENGVKQDEVVTDYAYTVLVTINPEIKLYLDESNQILEVEYLNNDAKEAYSEDRLIGMSLDDGLSQIVETAIKKEYLKVGNSVTVDVDDIKKDTVKSDSIIAVAEQAINTILAEKDFDATVITQTQGNLTTTPSSTSTSEAADQMNDSKDRMDDSKDGMNEATDEAVDNPTAKTPESSATVENHEEKECSRCGGSGECQGCHAGRDACPACSGTGYETCPMCDESGLDHGQTCATCGGSHKYLCNHCKGVGTAVDCPECNGTFKCPTCVGTGIQK